MHMEWSLGYVAIACLTFGLIAQAFEMRKINQSLTEASSANIFMNKRNFKWYALIGLGIVLWYAAERI